MGYRWTASIPERSSVDDLDGTLGALTPKGSGRVWHPAWYAAMLTVYPNSAPMMPMTLRRMMIPTMTTPIRRKIKNQKQPLWPCRTTTTCGGGGVVWPIGESLSASVKGRRAAVPFRGELACHLILADGHQVRAWLRPESLRLPGFASGCNSAAVSALLEDIPELSVRH